MSRVVYPIHCPFFPEGLKGQLDFSLKCLANQRFKSQTIHLSLDEVLPDLQSDSFTPPNSHILLAIFLNFLLGVIGKVFRSLQFGSDRVESRSWPCQ